MWRFNTTAGTRVNKGSNPAFVRVYVKQRRSYLLTSTEFGVKVGRREVGFVVGFFFRERLSHLCSSKGGAFALRVYLKQASASFAAGRLFAQGCHDIPFLLSLSRGREAHAGAGDEERLYFIESLRLGLPHEFSGVFMLKKITPRWKPKL